MATDPADWRNFSPGDLSFGFPTHSTGDVEAAVSRSCRAFGGWAALSFDERRGYLVACRERLAARSEDLARLISAETGKPLREARLEMGAVVAKFDLTFADGEKYLLDEEVGGGPHPARIRQRARGPAAVIAPFNFPIHLGHGAAVSYLLAGNPVLFKPSPMAVNVGAAYAAEMRAILPDGVFEFVPGWGETGRRLALHPEVRAVCFTGSIPVGTALARDMAEDYSKSLALELGGKNSAIIWGDADLAGAASAVADGMCLTAGQRCNATSRALVHVDVFEDFVSLLQSSLGRFIPGDPMLESTMLGPVISAPAVERYRSLVGCSVGEWILPGSVPTDRNGHFVTPAVVVVADSEGLDMSDLAVRETFAPILVIERIANLDEAVARHEAWKFGLTASIFSENRAIFDSLGDRLRVGNLYANLPTTFSPSTLPFGGWGRSGNGHPGGRGFARFVADEQAVQWRA